jgi:hypothetical protein
MVLPVHVMQLPSMRPSFRRYCARREGEGRRGERAAGAVEDEKTKLEATRRDGCSFQNVTGPNRRDGRETRNPGGSGLLYGFIGTARRLLKGNPMVSSRPPGFRPSA